MSLEVAESIVRTVWRGSVGSQVSICPVQYVKGLSRNWDQHTQSAVGSKVLGDEGFMVLLMLCEELTRENGGAPAGILPLAFSDMPRSWIGTVLSTDESTDGVLEGWNDVDEADGVAASGWSSASESSSSPTAKALSSSGTLLR